jgi:membrane fusion protein (multidrug efflux system)
MSRSMLAWWKWVVGGVLVLLGVAAAGVALSNDPSILEKMSHFVPAWSEHNKESQGEQHTITVTSPLAKDVTITQPYVCQIRSQRHIDVRALQDGYLEHILVKEGQAVTKGQVMFKILPTLYQAKYDAENAEAQLAQIKFNNTEALFRKNVVSNQEVALAQAELDKANAKAKLALAELNFTDIKAPFDGIVDRLHEREGSLIKERDVLTTLSDNSVMWVYFNVPEARYLDFKARQGKSQDISKLKLVDSRIELVLANNRKFDQDGGDTVTVESEFNNETGNIPFRADFPNPDRLLRHGQTGTVRIHQKQKNAIVIPQRATFEILDKQYVWVVDENDVVHQRLITIEHGLEDIFVVQSGLDLKEKIVLEGIQHVHDGDKIEYKFYPPQDVLKNQKNRAE